MSKIEVRSFQANNGMPNSSALILGLGSNLGDSKAVLRSAVDTLRQRFGQLQVAPLYRGAPVSSIAQEDFLNTVVLIRSPPAMSLHEALERTQKIEQDAGRRLGERWGPRILDIDLLLWGDHRIASERLQLPHPRLRLRRFVLAPLVDLRPEIPLPPDRRPARLVLQDLEARLEGGEQRIERIPWGHSL